MLHSAKNSHSVVRRQVLAVLAATATVVAGLLAVPAPASAAPAFEVPFPCGQKWPGETRSNHKPPPSIDFNRPGTADLGMPVLASADGTVKAVRDAGRRSYGRHVVLDHGGGWGTLYAHLQSVSVRPGQRVTRGTGIGTLGNTGGSTGPHLHYEQLLNGQPRRAVLHGKAVRYYGTTVHTSQNCGAAPENTRTATPKDFPVRETLDGRTATTLSDHSFPDRYLRGTRVVILCQTSGGPTYGGSRVWDLTEDGLWIPDYYVGTGHTGFSPDLPRCAVPRAFPVTATLDGRTSKDISNRAVPNRYAAGSTVRVACQAYGGPTYNGSSLWDRTTDGLWIPDYYVRTGTHGRFPGLPLCDADQPGSKTGGGTSGSGRQALSDLTYTRAGLDLTAAYETFRNRPYDTDGANNCTIGYGHLLHRGLCTSADHARWGTISRERAVGLLRADADIAAAHLRRAVPTTPLRQHEFDALVDLVFNIGAGYFARSTVKEDLTASQPRYDAVPRHMLSLVNAGGRKLCGLYRRRVDDARVYTTARYGRTYATCPPGHV